ncbi:unnamed protein product [Cylicocyclus nassatus]|uniref:7TM GPCR serpentine receptor class x (Srx) domain-containing protein n=1 Tax=Cylicocyclus nassatus TaxID=53992 RepID=A0AA36M7Z7_CYLNA|nr:unnamed protein product [Cylicocyclus nassatus]
MEQHSMDIVVASTWLTILVYAVIANVLLVILIISSTETRTLTRYTYVDVVINAVVLIITVTSYAAVLNKIRTFRGQSQQHVNDAQSANKQNSRLEIRLLIQFLAGSLIYLLTWITWQWLPRLSPSKWMFFVMMSFSFSNNAMNPTIYLICNKSLREKLRHLLGCRWHKWHKTTMTILTRTSQTGRS